MFGRRERDDLQRRLDEAQAELERHRTSPIDGAVGKDVVLHCDDKRSIAGVLTGVHEDAVTLEGARLLVEGSGAFAQDGTIVVPRKRITWYQLGITIDDPRLPA